MKPTKITRQTLANEAAMRWKGQYPANSPYGADKQHILKALLALGENPKPDDVDAAIGNQSWTSVPRCNGCRNERPDFVVQVGDDADYESYTAYLCKKCIAEAVKEAKS